MNANYSPAITKALIESAHQPRNEHAACERDLDFAREAAQFFMESSDNFQRQSESLSRELRAYRIVSAALFFVLGAVIAGVMSR